ncbi:MAG: flagellar protein FlgN [Synergistaceae bacterium]|jgi:F0F1-type ATP synthase delta subunit|nr:flagellar protein FlgN [Synergistaceae bacterium]
MSEKIETLTDTLDKQNEILSGLLDITLRQREALKEGRLSDLQDIMSEMRHISVRAQAIETKRARIAADVASELGCEPIVSDIARVLPPEEAENVRRVAKALMETAEKLKLEMSILSRLMEEAKSLNEMLINEWRRIGARAAGSVTGAFDTRI